jgi:hypothetical protein
VKIVENRETHLSSPFLSHLGICIFEKVVTIPMKTELPYDTAGDLMATR